MNQKEIETKKLTAEWLSKSQADLESAEVLYKETDNYDIVVYHAHQAIEKYFKAKLLENQKTFKFTHDLNSLFAQVSEFLPLKEYEDDLSFVNSLYPRLRYPTGETVSRDDAEKCLKVAKDITNK